jgi:hypothetical protein
MNSPAVRFVTGVLKDARAYVVALILALGLAGWRALLHNHVRVRAWTVILAGVVVLLVVLAADWMRSRERDRATRLQGALDEANATIAARTTASATTAPTHNLAAQEALRDINALRRTLLRRTENYASTFNIDASFPEVQRYRYVVNRVRVLIDPLPPDLANLFRSIGPVVGNPPDVDAIISGLDHLETEVTNWGLRHEQTDART